MRILLSVCIMSLSTITFAYTPDNIYKLKTNKIIYQNEFPLFKTKKKKFFSIDTDYSNTLLISNIIAGVFYGYLLKQKYPNINFNKDYLYMSLMGQLMQSDLGNDKINTSFNPIDLHQLIHSQAYASKP